MSINREKKIGFTALSEKLGYTKSWLSHCIAGRRRLNEQQAARLTLLAPETRLEWWLYPVQHREDLEKACRAIRKVRLSQAEYGKQARERRRLRAAVEIVASWENEN